MFGLVQVYRPSDEETHELKTNVKHAKQPLAHMIVVSSWIRRGHVFGIDRPQLLEAPRGVALLRSSCLLRGVLVPRLDNFGTIHQRLKARVPNLRP